MLDGSFRVVRVETRQRRNLLRIAVLERAADSEIGAVVQAVTSFQRRQAAGQAVNAAGIDPIAGRSVEIAHFRVCAEGDIREGSLTARDERGEAFGEAERGKIEAFARALPREICSVMP